MRLLDGWKRSKLTWLTLLFALPVLLTACGVSDEELEAVQGDLQVEQGRVQQLEAQVESLETQVQTLQAQAADLQEREARRFAIAEVGAAFEEFRAEEPSPGGFLEFAALVQASGTPELQAKFVEIIDSGLAEAFPLPQEILSQAAAVIQAAGNQQVAE